MFALFYTFLYINDVKKRIHVQYWQNRKDRVSEYICVRASGASERFLEVLIVLQLKRSVKKVILSSKSGGGGCLYRPSPPPKKVGGYIPPIPPGFTPVQHIPYLLFCRRETMHENQNLVAQFVVPAQIYTLIWDSPAILVQLPHSRI